MNNGINSSIEGLLCVRNGGKYKLLWRLQKLEHELIFLKKTVGHDSTSFNSISAEEQLFQLASRFTHAHTLLTSSLFSKRLCFLIFCRSMEMGNFYTFSSFLIMSLQELM